MGHERININICNLHDNILTQTRLYMAMSHMYTPTVFCLSSAEILHAAEILHSPESTTVFLNRSAVFTCETRGGTTLWRVNGTQRETLLPDIRIDLVVSEITTPEGHSVQTLTIPARAQYNGTKVQCLSLIIDGSRAESDNATLTIQGISSLHLQQFASLLPVFTFCVSVCYHSARMRVTVLWVFV